jgi:hypothetical protein
VSGVRRLGAPVCVTVRVGSVGLPEELAGMAVEAVNEDWVVEDRWWTGRPVRRRYFELVLADGRNVTVFRELGSGRWFEQRA